VDPCLEKEFPMTTEVIKNDVFSAFSVDMPEFKRDVYNLDHYLDEIIKPHPQLTTVNVF
jgi:hypothetical protein